MDIRPWDRIINDQQMVDCHTCTVMVDLYMATHIADRVHHETQTCAKQTLMNLLAKQLTNLKPHFRSPIQQSSCIQG